MPEPRYEMIYTQRGVLRRYRGIPASTAERILNAVKKRNGQCIVILEEGDFKGSAVAMVNATERWCHPKKEIKE